MDPEFLREMEKALKKGKTLEKLTIRNDDNTLEKLIMRKNDNFGIPKEFCYHILLGTKQNTSLSELHLDFPLCTWDCPNYGRLAYVSWM